jgi:hypothetical protein
MFNNCFPKNRIVYEILWKNMVEPDRPQMGIYDAEHMGFACRITKARIQTQHTHNISYLLLFHGNNG